MGVFGRLFVRGGGGGLRGRPGRHQSLIDKSLVAVRDAELGRDTGCWRPSREYASERLEEGGEAASLYVRHADWCCKLTDRIGVGPWLTDEEFRGFAYDYDNVRVALAWAWRNGDDERALGLGCHRFWARQGLFNNAVAWLEAATPRIASAEAPVQLLTLKAAGAIAFFVLADTERANRYWARALTTAEELGADHDIAWIRNRLAGVAWDRGDPDLALAEFRRNLDHYRASGNRLGEADSLHFLGDLLRDIARFDEAEAALVDADAIYEYSGWSSPPRTTPTVVPISSSTEATSQKRAGSIVNASPASQDSATNGTSPTASQGWRVFFPIGDVTRRQPLHGGPSAARKRRSAFA